MSPVTDGCDSFFSTRNNRSAAHLSHSVLAATTHKLDMGTEKSGVWPGCVRVTKDTLVKQLEMSGQMDFLELPYHQAIMNDQIPLSIGGGIGQSRTYMYLLKKAHLGEVSVTVWPKILKEICAEKNIHVLE